MRYGWEKGGGGEDGLRYEQGTEDQNAKQTVQYRYTYFGWETGQRLTPYE